ncbi:spore cortex biosynthesis protein YabQ [Clostridium perfringens SM101]|uniref:Spore cortex biosynthesis protein YabQ n=1 Tax=Clostridium perfringens (strain SM101 / Type A) TaxID=289380 RepID=Q0SQ75_CLOPS|nr:spore cortex biosynthesis protein YabQ [Clostridium perfringens]ABG87835.1 spore cortex biosynthesis protein YabQ [Clostridium perfringens SM101]
MLSDINIQFKIVIFAILSGIIIGFLFDIYREFRGVCKNKTINNN